MSFEIQLQTITEEPHNLICPVTELFTKEVFMPWPVTWVGDGYQLYVATKGAQLIGAANVCGDFTEGLGYIRKIAVDPAHRNQGVGSALLHYAVDGLQVMGQARAAICPTNENNRRLYARLGFAEDPAETISPKWMFMHLRTRD